MEDVKNITNAMMMRMNTFLCYLFHLGLKEPMILDKELVTRSWAALATATTGCASAEPPICLALHENSPTRGLASPEAKPA